MHSFEMKRYIPFYPLFVFWRQCILLGGVSFRRIPFFLIYTLRFFLLEPLRMVEVLLFERRIRKHALKEDPIFIIGHWRSGTSHFQNILHQDPTFSTLSLYRMLFSDHFIWTESWLLPFLNRLLITLGIRYSFQRSKLDLTLSGELDTALCSIGSTQAYTWAHLFPKSYKTWMENRLFSATQDPDLSDYDYLIRKLSWQSKNKRIVVKSPGDTARIRALLTYYPKASFICLSRDSYEVYHSTVYLWNAIQRENSLQRISSQEIAELVLWTYPLLMNQYEQMKSLIPKGQLFDVSFEELREKPAEVLQLAYQDLNLGEFHPEDFAAFLHQNAQHQKAEYHQDPKVRAVLIENWKAHFIDRSTP